MSCRLFERTCKDSELSGWKQNPSAEVAKSNVRFVLMRGKAFIPAAKSSVVGSIKTSKVISPPTRTNGGKGRRRQGVLYSHRRKQVVVR